MWGQAKFNQIGHTIWPIIEILLGPRDNLFLFNMLKLTTGCPDSIFILLFLTTYVCRHPPSAKPFPVVSPFTYTTYASKS